LYGVVSYGAGLRLREFAIRTALGAQAGDIRRFALSHALGLWITGSAIGLLAAWPIGRALKSQLYGVGSADAVALAVAPLLLLMVALLAGFGPARRAGRVDPAVTLRGEGKIQLVLYILITQKPTEGGRYAEQIEGGAMGAAPQVTSRA